MDIALKEGGDNLKGIGSTLEGLDIIQFPYEYILEKAWTIDKGDDAWVNALADRHAGKVIQPVREAWKILFNDIYVQVPKTVGILPNYRPVMGVNSGRAKIDYSNRQLLKAWKMLLEVSELNRNALRLDVISVGRQLLGNYFLAVKNEFDRVYTTRDLLALRMHAAEMREILHDIDVLTSYHEYTSLDKWIDDARAYSCDPVIQDYYEKNARNLITTWGGTLNDYASRTWSGLVAGYYAVRWDVYIDAVLQAVENNQEFNQKELDNRLKKFEEDWGTSRTMTKRLTKGDLQECARHLLRKYEMRIN